MLAAFLPCRAWRNLFTSIRMNQTAKRHPVVLAGFWWRMRWIKKVLCSPGEPSSVLSQFRTALVGHGIGCLGAAHETDGERSEPASHV